MTLLSIVIFTICLAIQCTSMETDIDTKTIHHGGGMQLCIGTVLIVIVHTYNMCYLYHMCIKFKEKLNLISERFGLFTFADMICPIDILPKDKHLFTKNFQFFS